MGILGLGAETPEDVAGWAVNAAGDTAAWIGDRLGDAGAILTSLGGPILAGIAAIAVLRTVRWLLLLWRGRTPRVQISNFAWATSDKTDREATWVTSLFREQLAALRLDALDPLPDRAPGAPLVEIVEGVGQGVGRSLDIGKALGKLFRTVWPDSAYEVWGTLRPEGESGRISVQLIERRRGNRTLLNVALDEASWKDGAREAAMAVAGALYPRVRKKDRGPWTMWNRTVPRELMSHYHAARRHEEGNRLEHALDDYHAALDRDPLNPNLRLKIAMLQERLELDLDAWVTYEAIIDESDPRAWRGPDRRVYLLALYRLAVLLSNGRVGTQWVKEACVPEGEGTHRCDERHARRRDLLMSLECDPLLGKPKGRFSRRLIVQTGSWATSASRVTSTNAAGLLAMLRAAGGEAESRSVTLAVFSPPEDEESDKPIDETEEEAAARAERIDAVLQILSLRRLEELDAWLRLRPPSRIRYWDDWWIHRPPLRHWPRRREFARSAVRTSKLLVRLRVATSLELQLERREKRSRISAKSEIEEIREAHRRLTKRWPFPAAGGWKQLLHFLAPRRRWANGRADAWQLHYNAACTAASVLREDSVLGRAEDEEGLLAAKMLPLPPGTGREDVVAQVIKQLEEYAYRAGSRRVAAQAEWLAIDDPDLKGMRETPEFRLWASHHLPRGLPPEQPSRKADVRRFTARVVQDGARAFADAWRQRADLSSPAAAEIACWWEEERRAWETLGVACRDHLSWQKRLSWLKTLQEWLSATQRDDRLDFRHEARGKKAKQMMSEDLFKAVATLAGGDSGATMPRRSNGTTVIDWVVQRERHVRSAYEDGEGVANAAGSLLAEIERREALRAFRIWSRLAEALEIELANPNGEGISARLAASLRQIDIELHAYGNSS